MNPVKILVPEAKAANVPQYPCFRVLHGQTRVHSRRLCSQVGPCDSTGPMRCEQARPTPSPSALSFPCYPFRVVGGRKC